MVSYDPGMKNLDSWDPSEICLKSTTQKMCLQDNGSRDCNVTKKHWNCMLII